MTDQQELPFPKCADRILHMSDQCAEAMPGVREWAKAEGIEDRLDAALEYCRTFSKGPEAEWKSHLHLDIFFNKERPSFTCAISRRVPVTPFDPDGLKHYMLIGMIYDECDKNWSFHS